MTPERIFNSHITKILGPHVRISRANSAYVFDSEILLFLLISSLVILGLPAPFFSSQWYTVFGLLASLLMGWISVIAIRVLIELSKQRLRPADSLFFSIAVSILLSALALSIATVSGIANMQVLSIISWISVQSASVAVLFIALFRYTQAFQKRLGESPQDGQPNKGLPIILFSAFIFTSYLTTFLIGNSIGVVIGLAAILILRIPSVILSARLLKLSNSVKMKSMISLLILGIALEAVADFFFAVSIMDTVPFVAVWSISTYILGFFFLLVSCVSFVRWRSSPGGMVRLLQNVMEIIGSGVMELARKRRGRR